MRENPQNPFDIYRAEELQATRRQEAERSAARHRREALHTLMALHSGRVFLRDFLNFCQLFAEPTLRSNEQVQFYEGLRRAGMYLFKALAEDNPAFLSTLFQEEDQA